MLAASGSVLITAHGTPSASSRAIHASRLAVAKIVAISASSAGLLATRSALVAYFGSAPHSAWPSAFASLAKSRSLPAATMIGPVEVSNDSNGTTRWLPVRWRSGTMPEVLNDA